MRLGRIATREPLAREQTTKEKIIKEKTNRDLRPPVRSLRIGRCEGSCRVAAADERSRVAPSPGVVKRFSVAVDNCHPRFAAGAVKADSRAQRGRSEAERLEGDNADRTMESDGPPNRAGFERQCCRRSNTANHGGTGLRSPPSSVRPGARSTSVRSKTAWRERPRSVAAAVIGTPVRSRGRSRHGTCFERAGTRLSNAGGKERRPLGPSSTGCSR